MILFKPWRWWSRRWFRRTVVCLAVLVLAVRLALPSLVRWSLRKVGASQGYRVALGDADFALLRGEVSLWRLEAWSEQSPLASPPLVHLEYLHLDVDLSALLTGTLRLSRLEVDGVDARLRRLANGRLDLPVANQEPGPEVASDTESVQDQEPQPLPEPFDFTLPVQAEAVRLDHVRVQCEDQSVSPPIRLDLAASVRLSDLGHPERPARLTVSLHEPQVLDHLRVEASVRAAGRHLEAETSVQAKGLRPGPVRDLLAQVGMTPHAERLGFQAELSVVVVPHQEEDLHSAALIKAGPLSLQVDGTQALSMEQMECQVSALHSQLARIPLLSLRELHAGARRLENGHWLVAGMEFVPGGSGPVEATAATGSRQATPTDQAPPFVLEVAQADVMGLMLTVDDEAPADPVHLELGVLARINNLVLDPARPDETLTVGAMFQVTDLADIQVQASAQPFARRRTMDLAVDASRLNLDALQTYLEPMGLVGTLESGRLTLRLQSSAEIRDQGLFADLLLEQLSLEDATLPEPFQLGRLAVSGVEVTEDALRIADLTLSGTRVDVSMVADGLVLPGLHKVATPSAAARDQAAGPSAEPPAPDPSTGDSPSAPMRIEVARLAWNDTQLRCEDRRAEIPGRLALSDLDLLLTDLALGGPADQYGPTTATLRLTGAVEDLVRQLALDGQITSTPGTLHLDTGFSLRADGVVTTAVEHMLAAAGLESQLESGALQADLKASLVQQNEVLTGDAVLSALSWKDGEHDHLSLEELRVESFAIGPDAISVADIQITGPKLALGRAADGALEVAGLRLPAVSDSGSRAEPMPATVRIEEELAADSAEVVAATGPALPFLLDHLGVNGGSVRWQDASVEPPVDTTLRWDVEVREVGVGVAERTAAVELRAVVDGTLEQLTLQGTAHLPEHALQTRLQLEVKGLRAGPLASYLPDGLTAPLEHGILRASLTANQGPAAEGGSALHLAVTDVDYRDQGQEEPWLAWQQLLVDVPRMDAEAGVLEISRVSWDGLELEVRQEADHSLRALGLHWTPPAPSEEAASVAGSSDEEAASEAPSTDASRRQALPHVTLGSVDVGVERLRFQDRSAENTVPLDASLRLLHEGSSVICRAESEELAPLELKVLGRFAPLLETLAITIHAAPFAAEPSLDLSVRGEGLRGSQLHQVLPGLDEVLDASAWEDGRFQADLGVLARVRRRGPLQIDWSRGIGLTAELKDLRFQATPDGPVLLGLESVHAEVARLDQAGNVHVKRVEVVTPTARVKRTAEGLHVAGLTLKQFAAEVTAEAAPVGAEVVEETPLVADAAAPASTPGPEIRLDELLVSGIQLDYRDDSVTPASHLPLTDLELVLKGFTTRAFQEDRSVKFDLLVYGGNAEFPKRVNSASALTGLLSAAAKKLIGQSDPGEIEQRPVLDRLQVSGRLSFHPRLKGYVRSEVKGLELLSLAGPAQGSGVTIGDGVFHSQVDLRFLEDGGLATSSDLRFHDLSLSEAAGGPISTYLKLPAPLDTVLYVLKDEKDQHLLTVDFNVPAEGVSLSEVSRVATTTLVSQITNAIASTPLRLTSSLTDLVGIDVSSAPPLPDGDRVLQFAPGTPTVEASKVRALRDWAATVRANPEARVVLTQVLAPGDVELLTTLANPGPEECRALSDQLRQRRDRLLRDRTQLAAEALAHFAVGRREEGGRVGDQLQELDRQLAATESSMDQLHALLRPGAERRAARRTRDAGRDLGQRRLEHVQQALRELGIPATRLELRRARFVVDETLEQGAVLLVARVPDIL